MAYIKTGSETPGIRGLFEFSPETSKPMGELAQALLRNDDKSPGSSSLTGGERELIAAYVSHRNNCYFCHNSHKAVALEMWDGGKELADQVMRDLDSAPVSEKLKSLLRIAEKTAESGSKVQSEDVDAAKAAGASDKDIHDTVLIAAAFCMFNRYVDGLGADTPKDASFYAETGKALAERGYTGF